MPTFKVQGQIYHRVGSLLLTSGSDPQFLQNYFMGDAATEANHMCSRVPGTILDIVTQLQHSHHANNVYVPLFKTALERMPTDNYKVAITADKTPTGEHWRRFNAATLEEVAIVMVSNDFGTRDIVLQKRNNTLQGAAETHRSQDALQYPLIFWRGEDFQIPQIHPSTANPGTGKKVTAMHFYACRIMTRVGEDNHLLRCRQFFHQFIVDMYAKIESERLLYIRINQQKLRSEQYIHLRDAISNDANPHNLGKLVILPYSVTGSPRHMHEYTQDALTCVKVG